MKKIVELILIAIGIIVAFSSCSFGNKQQHHVVDSNMYSMSITNIDHEVVDNNSGEKGMRINLEVVLTEGIHSYKVQFLVFNENGTIVNLLDRDGSNLEVFSDLGNCNVPDGVVQEIGGDFFLPYAVFPKRKKGTAGYYIIGKLIRDNDEIVAETIPFTFNMIWS